MRIYIDGHSFHYEMENLVRLFYPNSDAGNTIVLHKDSRTNYSEVIYMTIIL